jgi:hypothetical protein
MELVSVSVGFPLDKVSVMADRLVYIFALLALGFIRLLPLSVCFVLGQAVGALLWLILPGYRRRCRQRSKRPTNSSVAITIKIISRY